VTEERADQRTLLAPHDAELGYVVSLAYFESCNHSEEVVSGAEVAPLR
jgi:hypothetical protein